MVNQGDAMASTNIRSWKLQEIVAHNANVNCLALGRKSGRVMVTGGDDKKVNLWAIGKSTCFMNLSGHVSPIECVQFNQLEELVCAGSRAGALKVWDLEAAKLVRTLNGHKYAIKSIDFHPYGGFLASGSADSSIKMWDTKLKSAIFTLNGHKGSVNSIKFSPDAKWVASGGEDGTIRIWDLKMRRVIKEFSDHLSAVSCVEFHPHEFLLASGSSDRSVKLYDLESFNLVSSERDVGSVRNLCFNPDGECLFTAVRDYLKVVGWEPSKLYDSVPVNWARVCDISTAQNQLVGASFHLTNVQVYMVDLKKVRPFSQPESNPVQTSPFGPNQTFRKSFSKAERPVSLKNRTLDVKTIEESTSGTDPEEESVADITNLTDYNEIFKGTKTLRRTPPPEPEPEAEPEPEPESYQEPEKESYQIERKIRLDPTAPQILGDMNCDTFEALSLDNTINNYHNMAPSAVNTSPYARSKSNLDQGYSSRTKQQDRENILPNIRNRAANRYNNLQRQSSCKDVPERDRTTGRSSAAIRASVSEEVVSRGTMSSRTSSRRNSFSKPAVTKIPNYNNSSARTSDKSDRQRPVKLLPNNDVPVDIYVHSKSSPEEKRKTRDYIPLAVDKPVGLDMDEFLPKNYTRRDYQEPNLSEAEVINIAMRGHDSLMSILRSRESNLRAVVMRSRAKGIKAALESAINMDDNYVLVDVLGVMNSKESIWDLDICVLVLPKIQELLQSKFESIITTASTSLRLILKLFGNVIKTNVRSPVGSWGVDIPREERYNKCKKCHDSLLELRPIVQKKTSMPGTIGIAFKELVDMLLNVID